MRWETHQRSVVKAVCWRLGGSLCTGLIGGVFTGSLALGLGMGAADCVLKIGVYYVHERLWQRIHWGLVSPTDETNQGGGI